MKKLALVLCILPQIACATGIDSLKSFLRDSRAIKAEFTQTVQDRNGKDIQKSSGTMEFSRPGKFRWVYEKPYEQLIVGDGKKVWMYDPDLNQVTVKKITQALGSSPAALLAGDNEIEANFNLRDAGVHDGLEWVEATPNGADSSFEAIRLGFRDGVVEAMELHDRFGHLTTIRFAALQKNPKLPPQSFVFTPPKGADVVGD